MELGFFYSALPMVMVNNIMKKRFDAILNAYETISKEYDEYRLRFISNNWLKQHGYPMRRGSLNHRRIR